MKPFVNLVLSDAVINDIYDRLSQFISVTTEKNREIWYYHINSQATDISYIGFDFYKVVRLIIGIRSKSGRMDILHAGVIHNYYFTDDGLKISAEDNTLTLFRERGISQ